MDKRRKVSGAWDFEFHKIVDQARQQYSRQLGKELSNVEVTRIWGEKRLTNFKIPKLKLRRQFK